MKGSCGMKFIAHLGQHFGAQLVLQIHAHAMFSLYEKDLVAYCVVDGWPDHLPQPVEDKRGIQEPDLVEDSRVVVSNDIKHCFHGGCIKISEANAGQIHDGTHQVSRVPLLVGCKDSLIDAEDKQAQKFVIVASVVMLAKDNYERPAVQV
eukprot:scaffold212029_cov43-Prasinocladus_malaysianus.AAC.1